MRIKELASRAGVTVDAVRFYEKQGLLEPPVRSANGYRSYTERDLRRLAFITQAKSIGMTLGEAAAFLRLDKADRRSCESLAALARGKLGALDRRIAELTAFRNRLQQLVDACTSPDPRDRCAVAVRFVGSE